MQFHMKITLTRLEKKKIKEFKQDIGDTRQKRLEKVT